jgi:hypothetical protein
METTKHKIGCILHTSLLQQFQQNLCRELQMVSNQLPHFFQQLSELLLNASCKIVAFEMDSMIQTCWYFFVIIINNNDDNDHGKSFFKIK